MRSRLLVWWLLVTLLAVACTGADDAEREQPEDAAATGAGPVSPLPPLQGGSVTYGAVTAPDNLNPWVARRRDAATLVTAPILETLWRTGPDGTVEPRLLAGDPRTSGGTDDEPFTVTYELRDDAVWSDGEPIDGRDMLFTLGVCQRTSAQPVAMPCDRVDLTASSADGRRATVVFDRPVATWRRLLATLPVLPEHVLRGRDLATAWRREVPVSSGPFAFASWGRDDRMVLIRNDHWWGEPAALDRLVFTFEHDPPLAAVVDGAADVATVAATLDNVERARASDRMRVAIEPGQAFEAIDFNAASRHVSRAAVRRALAAGLDAGVILDELVTPVAPATAPRTRLLQPDPEATDAEPSSPAVDAARALDDAGCPLDADGVRACAGERMDLTLVTDGDDWEQRIIGEYVATQLAPLGVVVTPARRGAAGGSRDWDLRVTAVRSQGDPVVDGERWRCDGPGNTQAFCDRDLDALLDRAALTLDTGARDDIVADAELLLARERPTFPLYAVPQMLVYRDTVRGPTPNGAPWTVTWNTEEWVRLADEGDVRS